MNIATIILAAGQGTRMKSKLPKVLHPILGQAMLRYVMDAAKAVSPEQIFLVVGKNSTQIEESVLSWCGECFPHIVVQSEQRGTGHAVSEAMFHVPNEVEYVLVLYGDTPLLTNQTISRLVESSKGHKIGMLSTRLDNPFGYGRLIRHPETGWLEKIVEERDCTKAQKNISEINAGVYVFETSFLREALKKLTPHNAQNELYLTDVVSRVAAEERVPVLEVSNEEVLGVNDRIDLAKAEQVMRMRVNQHHMRQGVTLLDPHTISIEPGVTIGIDTVISSQVHLKGKTSIGADCLIDQGTIITSSTILDGCHIKPYTVILDSQVGKGVQIGPFAHLRPDNVLGDRVKIGNFVELKKTHIDDGSKANHLSYLGDAKIGKHVNIGCGTITCNYDGEKKHQTTIEDGVFVGSDTQFVAPVRIHKEAFVAAGTTVTKDVPEGALALSRVTQVNVLGYREKKRKKAT